MAGTIRPARHPGQCDELWDLAAGDTAGGFLPSGTRNIVWQYWHLTSFPRTSSGTERILRQRRFGQMSWHGIKRTLREFLSAIRPSGLNVDLSNKFRPGLPRST